MSILLGAEATAGLNASTLGLSFCEIPAGTYEVGAEYLKDNPVRNVTTDAFALAETPTTNAQFAAGFEQLGKRSTILMVEALRKHRWTIVARGTEEEVRGIGLEKLREILDDVVGQKRAKTVGDLFVKGGLKAFDSGEGLARSARIVPVTLDAYSPKGFDGHNQPALTSAFESSAFAALFGLELPTGVQWEIAAGDLRDEKYRDEEELRRVAHFYPADATENVKSKEKTEFGLFGMLGNVWEAMANPYKEGEEEREFRGGSWSTDPEFVNPMYIDLAHPSLVDFRNPDLGFRLLRP